LKFDAWYDDLEGRKCTQKDYAWKICVGSGPRRKQNHEAFSKRSGA
jgi:hypothetical protein